MQNNKRDSFDIAEVKYKVKDGGKVPKQGIEYDFGTDLYTREDVLIIPSAIEATVVGVGLHTEFDPTKYGMLLSLRSSMSKLPISMANHIGVIEGTYRGEIMIPLRNTLNTRVLGEISVSNNILIWDEASKKLVRGSSHRVADKHHSMVYDQLRTELELLEADNQDINKLGQIYTQRLLPVGTIMIKKGTRLAQAYMATKHAIDWVEVETLSETERGTGGFGSTNK